MHLLLIHVELHFPGAHSLKDKRSILKRMLNRLRSDYNISVAEVEHHDVWQSAGLAVVAVGNLRPALERIDRELEDFLSTQGDAEVTGWQLEWL